MSQEKVVTEANVIQFAAGCHVGSRSPQPMLIGVKARLSVEGVCESKRICQSSLSEADQAGCCRPLPTLPIALILYFMVPDGPGNVDEFHA